MKLVVLLTRVGFSPEQTFETSEMCVKLDWGSFICSVSLVDLTLKNVGGPTKVSVVHLKAFTAAMSCLKKGVQV